MQVYADLVFILNFLVDFFLLMGTDRLAGFRPKPGRAAAAAAVGAVYALACLLPGFAFLGGLQWALVSLRIMAVIAFGCHRSALRKGLLFALLNLSLGGAAVLLQSPGISGLVLSAAGVGLVCLLGFGGKMGRRYFRVTLSLGEKQKDLTALEDTGNTLRDPVTGESVLVAGPGVAAYFLGLTPQQLKDPLATLEVAGRRGLRLIPYRSVGEKNGMLLAVRFPQVRIEEWVGSALVAFSPEDLDAGNRYQLLTGGNFR
jgi:stage II sporulation protein GA (sporulation sigma-E factor processing peptidase)